MRFPVPIRGASVGARRRAPRGPVLEYFERRVLLSTFTVDNTGDDGAGTLRWAIVQVNADTTPSVINFDLSGSGVRTITVASALPTITHPVAIRGGSQPDYSGQPLVRLDGSALPTGQNGLVIAAGDSTIAGLIITGFKGAGIVLTGGGGNSVASCTVGLDPSSFTAQPNGEGVVIVSSSNNTVGGDATTAGNLISGNSGDGVKLAGSALDTVGNVVSGNFIGVSRDGLQTVGNGGDGVLISGAVGTVIGGSTGLGNVISGNGMNGVEINSGATSTQILGNAIGLAADGAAVASNLRDGVLLNSAPSTTIGGTSPDAANQISGNHGSGVRTKNGAAGLIVQGNQIGADASGRVALGNFGDGLTIGTGSAMIGGMGQGAGNVIAFNGSGVVGSGVQFSSLATGVSILSNSIHDNAGIGINFGNGPTPNHPTSPSPGPGPNNWQNYPILSTAQSDGQVGKATGVLMGAASQSYLIQVFWSPQPDPTGFGEGQEYVGSFSVTTDGSGQAALSSPAMFGAKPGGFVSVTATDSEGNTSEFSKAVVVIPVSDLAVQLSASPSPAPQGSTIIYTASVTNLGQLTAHHVVLTAHLPPGVTVDTPWASQGGTPVVQGSTVTSNVGTLEPGATAVITVAAHPGAGFTGSLVSSANATMDESDADPTNNSASLTVPVGPAADLALSLTSGPATGHVGDLLTYDLSVTNAGPATASNVVLTFPFSSITSYVSATGTQGAGVLQAGRLVIDVGSLASGGQAHYTIVLKATGVGTIDSVASLTSDTLDPTPNDEFATLATTIRPQADLRLVMQAPTVAADGHNVVYGVTITNAGPNDADDVTIQDLLPEQTVYVAATLDNGGSVSVADGIVSAVVGGLANGASTTLWIVAVPNSAVGTTLTNAARVASSVDDPDDANNADWRDTPVRPISDLAVTMTPISPSTPRGQPVTFNVDVVNQGPAAEPNALVSIPLPDWAGLVSASSTQGAPPAVVDGVLIGKLGALNPGGTARLTFTLAPKAGTKAPLSATASVHGDDPDFNQVDNTAGATVAVTASSDLLIVVDPPSVPAHERSTFMYSVVVTANGPDDASNVVIRAPLPPGVEFVSAASTQGPIPVFNSGLGVVFAQVGGLASGGSATLAVVVRPIAASAGVTLAASAVQDEFDPTPDDSATAVLAIGPSVGVGVCLYSVQTQADVGDYVTWVASVINAGPSPASDVVLNLPLSSSWNYGAATTTQGEVQRADGQISARLGTLAPGQRAIVLLFLSPTAAGSIGLSASVASDQFDLDPADDQTKATLAVQESPGVITFGQSAYQVDETSGQATIPVYRTVGARGTVTVPYFSQGGNAAPGVDYQPVSGLLTFGPGETVKNITVPVLANPHDNHDEGIGIYLGSPTGGAVLGGIPAVPLTIHDVDPDFTPPVVQGVTLNGDANGISSLTIGFSEPLDLSSVSSGAGFGLRDLGASGVYGAGDNHWVAFTWPSYDVASNSVTITPTQPLAAGHFYAIWVGSTGSSAITDLAGNPLGGGVDYVGLFGRGTSLSYTDSTGNLVGFQLTGGGFLDVFRNVSGDADRVSLQQAAPGSSTLSGSVARQNGRGSGVTYVGTIDGLGAFGQVRVTLKSPPFIVRNYPFALTTGKAIVGRPASAPRVVPVRQRPVPVRRR